MKPKPSTPARIHISSDGFIHITHNGQSVPLREINYQPPAPLKANRSNLFTRLVLWLVRLYG